MSKILLIGGELTTELAQLMSLPEEDVVKIEEVENDDLKASLVVVGEQPTTSFREMKMQLDESCYQSPFISTTTVKDRYDFLSAGGRLIVNESYLENSLYSKLLGRINKGEFTLYLEESFPEAEFFVVKNFKISGEQGIGHYSDVVVEDASINGFNGFAIRGFTSSIISYLSYLKKEEIAAIPFEVEYGISDTTFAIQFVIPVDNFGIEFLYGSFHEKIMRTDPFRNFLNLAVDYSDITDITFHKKTSKLIILGAWSLDFTDVNNRFPSLIISEIVNRDSSTSGVESIKSELIVSSAKDGILDQIEKGEFLGESGVVKPKIKACMLMQYPYMLEKLIAFCQNENSLLEEPLGPDQIEIKHIKEWVEQFPLTSMTRDVSDEDLQLILDCLNDSLKLERILENFEASSKSKIDTLEDEEHKDEFFDELLNNISKMKSFEFNELVRSGLSEEEDEEDGEPLSQSETIDDLFSDENSENTLVKGVVGEDDSSELVKGTGQDFDNNELVKGSPDEADSSTLVKGSGSDVDENQLVKGSAELESENQLVSGEAEKQDDYKKVIEGVTEVISDEVWQVKGPKIKEELIATVKKIQNSSRDSYELQEEIEEVISKYVNHEINPLAEVGKSVLDGILTKVAPKVPEKTAIEEKLIENIGDSKFSRALSALGQKDEVIKNLNAKIAALMVENKSRAALESSFDELSNKTDLPLAKTLIEKLKDAEKAVTTRDQAIINLRTRIEKQEKLDAKRENYRLNTLHMVDNNEVKKLKEKCLSMQGMLDLANKRVSALSAKLSENGPEVKNTDSVSLAMLKESIESYQNKIVSLESEITSLKEQQSNVSEQTTVQNNTDEAEAKRNSLKVKEQDKLIAKITEDVKDLSDKLQKANQEKLALAKKAKLLESRAAAIEKKAGPAKVDAGSKHRIKQLETLNEKHEASAKKAAEDLNNKKKEVMKMKSENTMLSNKIKELERKVGKK